MTNNIFARARAYTNLTPAERALLKLVEGLICAALVAALPVVAEALGRGGLDWPAILRAALAAASVAILMALTKYARAQSDPTLATALASAGAPLATVTGTRDTVDTLDAGGTPATDTPTRPVLASAPSDGASRQSQL